ncbi:MAG: oligosaccharide flippase family protein [Candidatus Hodarchaeota archaeon]
MQKKQILINAIMSLLQVVIVGGVLFVLYRFLLNTIGIKQLGIWSIVFSTSSIATIAKEGLSVINVKFVAQYLARDEKITVSNVIQTSTISISLFSGITFLVAYPIARWLLGVIVPFDSLDLAYMILPYAFLSLWFIVIASVFYAAIDGFERIDLRAMILTGGAVLHLAFCYIIVPTHGLKGLAYAYVIKSLLVLIVSWIILKNQLSILPFMPYKWDFKLFKEMISYGLNMQAVTISQMLYDPITKALITRFGDLTLTGYYEMASRMLVQFRALLISANRVLVPTIANLRERSPESIKDVYRESYNLLLYLALPFFSAIIVFSPLISQLWIGYYEQNFVMFTVLLSIGWFISSLACPAYFTNLGINELRWNTYSHIIIGVLNFSLGFVFGYLFGGTAVVVSWVISLITGSIIIPFMYHRRYKLPLVQLLPKEHISIGLASIAGASISMFLYHSLDGKFNPLINSSTVVFLFITIIVFPFWTHPMRKRLIRWIAEELFMVKKRV